MSQSTATEFAYKLLFDPGGFSYVLELVIFKLISSIDILNIPYEIFLRQMLQYLVDLARSDPVMAWCCQATSHNVNQC